MQNKRKRLITILIFMSLATTLVACGKKKQPEETVVEDGAITTQQVTTEEEDEEIVGSITMWTNREDLVQTKLREYKLEFEEKYPDTEVKIKYLANYDEAISARIKDGDFADVVLIPEGITNKEVTQNFFPFGTYEELKKSYKKQYLTARMEGDYVYGLPQYVEPQGIAYNKKVFANAGIFETPKSTEDFLKALRRIRITQPDVIPFYMNHSSENGLDSWQQHAWGALSGRETYHYTGMLTQGNPFSKGQPNYILHKLLYDIEREELCEGDAAPGYATAKSMMNKGDVGCMMVDWSQLRFIRAAGVNPDDIGYMPFPNGKDEDTIYATATIGYCYGVNKNSAHRATAKAWVEYLLKNTTFATSEGALSIKKKAELPYQLSDFKGTKMVLCNSYTDSNRELYEKHCMKTGLILDSAETKEEIVNAAGKKNISSDSEEWDFEYIMNQWNKKWNIMPYK